MALLVLGLRWGAYVINGDPLPGIDPLYLRAFAGGETRRSGPRQ